MPELPEVETVVRTLRPQILGEHVGSIWTSGLPLRMARPVDRQALERICTGANICGVRRRGKYILVDLQRSGAETTLGVLVHLGMTGRLRFHRKSDATAKHTHVVWSLSQGTELRFVDPRRFGWVEASQNVNALPELCNLGLDPLTELGPKKLASLLATSRAPVKSFLLDQRRVAGLGNIYACEALFRARIHPRTQACHVQGLAAPLYRSIRETLETGIANCGTSFRDFVDAAGNSGRNSEALLVYGRTGKPCMVCSNPILRWVDSGRSTFFCALCQTKKGKP